MTECVIWGELPPSVTNITSRNIVHLTDGYMFAHSPSRRLSSGPLCSEQPLKGSPDDLLNEQKRKTRLQRGATGKSTN